MTTERARCAGYLQSYLHQLQARSIDEIEERCVAQVARALRQSDGAKRGPHRLASIVSLLNVDPRPLVNETARDGALRYDEATGRFRVSLRRNTLSSSYDRRLTYAHEIAHSFFFVPDGGSWTRAINMIARGRETLDRCYLFNYVGDIEEKLCDTIASKMVVMYDAWLRLQVLPSAPSAIMTGALREPVSIGKRPALRL